MASRTRAKKPRPFSNQGYRDEDIVICAWDVETDGLGGVLLFATTSTMDGVREYDGPDIVASLFQEWIQFPYPAIWYAHNAQYDWRYIIDFIRDNSIHCEIGMRNETDIYQIVLHIDGIRIVLRDSLAVFPGTLREMLSSFCPELPKLEIDFDIEGFDCSNPSHRLYARRDSEGLRIALSRMNLLLSQHFGVNLGHTTSGTALNAWQHTIPDDVYYQPSVSGAQEDFIRSGYYGGIVFLTRTEEIEDCETYDINSSYPFQLRAHGVPYGNCCNSRSWDNESPGIFKVKVSTPSDLRVPILPRRDQHGYMRLSGGTFWTTVTNIELQFAIKHGYKVLQCESGLIWEDLIFPFGDLIDKCESLRKKHKHTAIERLAKLMQNSLYGKFGSKRERWKVFVPESEMDTLNATALDEAGYFWKRLDSAESLRCIPIWAAWTTAHARLHLLEQVYRVGVKNVIYGDTDSITVRKGFGNQFAQGNEYGKWKLEKQWRRFRAIAPKLYSGELYSGEFKGAAKGLPHKSMLAEDWKLLLSGDSISKSYLSLESLIVAMKSEMRPARKLSRKSTDLNNSINWECKNGLVHPHFVFE